MKQVNILGTSYTVKSESEVNNPKLKECDGYCDDTLKLCVVADFVPDTMSKGNLEEYQKKVIRHEIIHAFLFESGMAEMSADESFVDWIAYQFPKLHQAFQEAECV